MKQEYPQNVENSNPTNGGLQNFPQSVKSVAMSKQPPQFIEIGLRLTAVRKGFSDLNQKEWAIKHGFSDTQYNNWEKGTRRITVDEAERLCNAYGLTLDFIYRGRRDGLSETASKVI